MEDYPRDLTEFEARFATDEACRQYLFHLRWPDGFRHKHLDYYLDEFTFRFNRRRSRSRGKLFFPASAALNQSPTPGSSRLKKRPQPVGQSESRGYPDISFWREDYHTVPDLISRKEAHAETFASYWSRHVGPAELVYTRTPEGRKILLRARGKSLAASFLPKSERITAWK